MLIVSKQKDYYDGAHDGFIDKSIVYQRTPIQSDDFLQKRYDFYKNVNFPNFDRVESWPGCTEAKELFLVGFCGKYYIGLHHVKKYLNDINPVIDKYIYSLDDIIACLELVEKKNKWWQYNYNSLIDFYNKYNNKEYYNLFIEYRVPIFYIGTDRRIVLDWSGGDKKLVLNPILKNIEFYKTGVDAKMAFSSVQTFISNVLTNPEKESMPISNKDKIESHGFDFKYSFRKSK